MNSELSITILCDNFVNKPVLIGEHGFSVLVEVRGTAGAKKLLFDTGQGLTLLHNASKLQIDLTSIDAVILSHGHYDHANGLSRLAGIVKNVPVYIHPYIFRKKYKRENDEIRYTGISWKKTDLKKYGFKFLPVKSSMEVFPGVILSGRILSMGGKRGIENALVEKRGKLVPDSFLDEIALIILTERGPVVVTGCAHIGLPSVLATASFVGGKKEVYALIGGFHLARANTEEIKEASLLISQYRVKEVIACHCTGFRFLKELQGNPMVSCWMGETGLRWQL